MDCLFIFLTFAQQYLQPYQTLKIDRKSTFSVFFFLENYTTNYWTGFFDHQKVSPKLKIRAKNTLFKVPENRSGLSMRRHAVW